MKRLTFLLFIVAAVSSVSAQTILLKSGDTVPANNLVRNGDLLMVSVKTPSGGTGQVGYHIADVQELSLPTPDAVVSASQQIASGDFANALKQIEPVVEYQKSIRDIPGNWWARTALIEVSALAGLNRLPEATALVTEISNNSKDPEILVAAKLQIVLTTKYDDPRQALAAYDSAISQSSDPRTLSLAWIAKGDIYFAQHEFDDALMAYLTVAIFYPEHNPLLAKALWGAGQAYAKLKDTSNATRTYEQLVNSFPDSPEAALAKTALIKKDKKT